VHESVNSLSNHEGRATYIGKDICTEREPNSEQGSIWKRFAEPFYSLTNVPGGPGIVEHTGSNFGLRAASGIDHTCFPIPICNEWREYMAQIEAWASYRLKAELGTPLLRRKTSVPEDLKAECISSLHQ
jgi:hypothetical protein